MKRRSAERVRKVVARVRRSLEVGEAARLRAIVGRLLRRLFDLQRGVIDDPHRWKAVLCARRAGKTSLATTYALVVALGEPDRHVVYVRKTLKLAKRDFWGPLKKLDRQFSVGLKFNHQDLTATAPNGSVVRLGAAENEPAIDDLRGPAYDLVLVDECGSVPQQLLELLIDDVVVPALGDRRGTLVVLGTPGYWRVGTFWQATGPDAFQVLEEPGRRRAASRPWRERDDAKWRGVEWSWSFHRWTRKDTAAAIHELRHLWDEALEVKRRNGWGDDHPKWLREYLGEWAILSGSRVFRYERDRDSWADAFADEKGARRVGPGNGNAFGLPAGHEWYFVCGIDIGVVHDKFAIEAAAYSDTCPTLYHVYEYARTGLVIAEMARALEEARDACGGFEAMVADTQGLGRKIVDQLSSEYGLSVDPARKQEKRDHIELLNSDFVEGRAKVLRGTLLEEQLETVLWDEKRPNREKRSIPNDCSDAFLYVCRHAMHRTAREPGPPPPKPGSAEAIREQERRELAALSARHDRARGRGGLDGGEYVEDAYAVDASNW